MSFLDQIPLTLLTIASLMPGLTPFVPESHIREKLKMLRWGNWPARSTFLI